MTLSGVFIPVIVAAYFVGGIPFGPIIARPHGKLTMAPRPGSSG